MTKFIRFILISILVFAAYACNSSSAGISGGTETKNDSDSSSMWSGVTEAIDSNSASFPGGLAVEIATSSGVVYSHAAGDFTNTKRVLVASASKWVSATAILRLVNQGQISLDEMMSGVLKDENGNPWSGNMGKITLRRLLSFTSGISGDVPLSDMPGISLAEAVNRIYADQSASASEPGSYFYYGSTHLRIAARYAEVKTGKTWKQIYDEQIRIPLGWSSLSSYVHIDSNPNIAGGLMTTGIEYMRFMMLQLNKGMYGNVRMLSEGLVDEQRKDQYLPGTYIEYSPYMKTFGLGYHYGFGNWRECDSPELADACDVSLRISSTGAFGWAPWIDINNDYAAVIMTKQNEEDRIGPSEDLKGILAGIIPEILKNNPQVIRTIP